MQNISASNSVSVPSLQLRVLTPRITSLTEEQFVTSSLLVESAEENVIERLISGMKNCCLQKCPSMVWGKWRKSEEGAPLLGRSVAVSQVGLSSFHLSPQC